MKNKTILLTRTLLRNGEGLNLKGSSTFARVSIILVFAIIIPLMMFGIGALVKGLLGILIPMGQAGIILNWGISINATIVFIFGIFYIISTFYFASDIEYLLPLPLKPRQIVGAKFLVVTVYEYLTTAVLFFPIWLTYGVVMGSGVLYYLYGLIIYLLLPITPLAAASILTMLIMRFTNLSKHRDTMKVLGGILGIVLGIGINLVAQSFAGNMSQEQMLELIQKGDNSLLGATTSIFPTIQWGTKALLSSGEPAGFINVLLYIGFSILVYVILLWLGELIYLRGAAGMSETGSGRKKNGSRNLEKEVVQGSVIRTYTLVELKLLFRTPIYFINCVLINFLWPVFLVVPLMIQSEQGQGETIQNLLPSLDDPKMAGPVLIGAFVMALFFGGTNGTTSTSISREGQELFIKKYIPVSYRQQLIAKVLSGVILGMAGILMMVLFAIFVMNLPIWLGILVLLTAWMPILLTGITGILIDLHNPKLDWDNEQKAVKQNVNVLFNMIVGFAAAGMTLAAIPLSSSLPLTALVLVAGYGLLCTLLTRVLFHQGVRQFRRLEG